MRKNPSDGRAVAPTTSSHARRNALKFYGQPDNVAVGPERAFEQRSGALARLADPSQRAHDYAGRSKSEATIRAYGAGWRDFLSFCEQCDASPSPADEQTVAAYLAELADRGARAATIARRLVVISQAHTGQPTCPRQLLRRWSAAPTPGSAAPSAPPRTARRPRWSMT